MSAKRQAHKRHQFTVEELLTEYSALRGIETAPVTESNDTSAREVEKQPRPRSAQENEKARGRRRRMRAALEVE